MRGGPLASIRRRGCPGIKHHDIIKLYNDAAGYCVLQWFRKGTIGIIHSYASSANYDPLEPGKPDSIDRVGV